jgi:hypothetical protein
MKRPEMLSMKYCRNLTYSRCIAYYHIFLQIQTLKCICILINKLHR